MTLRKALISDASDAREFTVYDGVPVATDEEAVAVLRRIEDDQERGEAIHWGICPAGWERVVGTCGYYRGFADQVGEIGYILGDRYRGRGYMAESVRLAVGFGFEVMELATVVAYTDATNLPSMAVLRRCGFTEVADDGAHLTYSIGHEQWAGSRGR